MTNRIFALALAGALVASPLFVFAHDGSDDQGKDSRERSGQDGNDKGDNRGGFDLRGSVNGFFGGRDGKNPGFVDPIRGENGVRADGNVAGRIEMRIDSLENLIDRIESSDRLSDDQKARMIAGIEAQIDLLQGLQARVDNGESKSDIKADLKLALKGKMLAMPKAGVEAAADRVLRIVDRAETLADRLQARIDDGKDVSVSVEAHASLVAHLNDAKAEANAAIDLVADLSLDSDDDDAIAENRRILVAARANIEDAYQALKAAREDVQTILDDLDISLSAVVEKK
ncbi:MAG: hypothetical protein QOE22_303 [Candidatus Parcubacteria bacterium]|nr:hypothetical protein [Candidatus Parcubacteria bacterium]